MDRVVLKNAALCGTLKAIPSKSDAHRAEICAFLSGTESICPDISEDIKATKNALKALSENKAVIDCGESGSTLRFLIPVAAALDKATTFTGKGRLPERPLGEYLKILPAHGVKCECDGKLPLKISGKLTAGRYEIAGDISSQYISGLLFALPLLDGDSEIVLTSPLQSKPYVDMTVKTLSRFGIDITETENGYFVKGNQQYKKCGYALEGDWSQAAFFLAGGAISGDVTLTGLDINSAQGDREIFDILRRFGAEAEINNGCVRVKKSALSGIEINVESIPDLVPPIAVLAAYAKGRTVITGGERLRLKESDRILSVVTNLKKMGVEATETPDGMIINGGSVKGAELSGFNDHRIVMAFSIIALNAQGETVITDAMSINKSYPAFFEDYVLLGGKADVICDWK